MVLIILCTHRITLSAWWYASLLFSSIKQDYDHILSHTCTRYRIASEILDLMKRYHCSIVLYRQQSALISADLC